MRGVLTNRSVLHIAGEESRAFLQGLVTQNVLHVAEGEAVFAALLSPQGKILFDFFLAPRADGFFIDCDATAAAALLKRLALYRLRARIALEERPELAVSIGGSEAFEASYADPRLGALPVRSIIARNDSAPAADEAYDAARVAGGVPEFGRDFASDEVFLMDVNYDALNAVSYAKGCFIGQEVTSRMKRKGEVRKRTLIARHDGPPLTKGAAVTADDVAIGEILSGREGASLALIRIDRLADARRQDCAPSAEGRPLQISFPAYLEPE